MFPICDICACREIQRIIPHRGTEAQRKEKREKREKKDKKTEE